MHGVELLDEESELLHLGGGGVAAEPALDLGPPHVVHHDLVIHIELVINQVINITYLKVVQTEKGWEFIL